MPSVWACLPLHGYTHCVHLGQEPWEVELCPHAPGEEGLMSLYPVAGKVNQSLRKEVAVKSLIYTISVLPCELIGVLWGDTWRLLISCFPANTFISSLI